VSIAFIHISFQASLFTYCLSFSFC